MQSRLLSPLSSADTRDSQQSVANFSGSQIHYVAHGIIEHFKSESNSFSSGSQKLIVLNVMSSSDEFTINNVVDIEDWKKSLDYSDEQVNDIIKGLLEDYELDPNSNNIGWLKTVIDTIIQNYEKEYSLTLKGETRKMISNLITKMSYDKLTVKKYLN